MRSTREGWGVQRNKICFLGMNKLLQIKKEGCWYFFEGRLLVFDGGTSNIKIINSTNTYLPMNYLSIKISRLEQFIVAVS